MDSLLHKCGHSATPDVIYLTEMKLQERINDSAIDIPG